MQMKDVAWQDAFKMVGSPKGHILSVFSLL
jgi:hypothetical protein